jgi:peptide/nickel transport system ATP-binding protein
MIQVKSLTKMYDQFTAVSEVDFEIFQGETLGLIGESGCGKSTLSRMLMGLIPITSGEIDWKGESWFSDRVGIKKKDRKRVQMVFQDPFSSLNPKITIGEQIMEPMRIHGIGKNSADRWSKAVQWMEKVGMPEPEQSLYKYPHAFSGGQRQRIVIARALAAEPECIICDESVAALDVSVQSQVLNLLNQLKAELGLTFLFISHDLHVVRYMCDRVMIMQHGKIVEMGATEAVFQHPQHPYSQTLLSK